jgi:exopolysaccharide biosynthesis polyprenyl glycosylphosphotransferase
MVENMQIGMEDVIRLRRLECNVGGLYNFSKRVFDIFAAISLLLVLLPLLIIVAIMIKLTSRGKVLYVQERNGFQGKIFKMYKFRSMIMNADTLINELESKNEAQGPMFKIKDDPRVTKVGRFIRKTSIDELPQLFNIIRGEMTFVGPRPPLPEEVAKYESWHKLRLSVKPGLTGLWQISGRSHVGFEEMIRMDLRYIRERSIIYDIKIIIKTIPVIFGSTDAF